MRRTGGGPAFPAPKECHVDHRTGEPTGLTKREWFAGMALIGILAKCREETPKEKIAAECNLIADAMIAEGSKE
jgi:hypothetical protein